SIGRLYELAVAEYFEAQRLFRHRLRVVVAALRERYPPELGHIVPLAGRAAAIYRRLQALHPGATWAHVVRVFEQAGTDLGSGSVEAKANRLQAQVSRARAKAAPAGPAARLTRRRTRPPRRKTRVTRRRSSRARRKPF